MNTAALPVHIAGNEFLGSDWFKPRADPSVRWCVDGGRLPQTPQHASSAEISSALITRWRLWVPREWGAIDQSVAEQNRKSCN